MAPSRTSTSVVLFVTLGVLVGACDARRGGTDASPAAQARAEDGPFAAENAPALTSGGGDGGGPLADTTWHLVEFQSMDDATGTRRPDDPSQFTMRLNGDGTVEMRLDCNRANGTWSAEPSSDPTNGRFRFGRLAATRALCSPPNLDEFIVAQAEYVRGYLLRGVRLYLSLMAEGRIFAWERRPPGDTAFTMGPNKTLEAALLRHFPGYRDNLRVTGRPSRFVYALHDLNADGEDEALVYMLGPYFCGTGGCNLLVLTRGASAWQVVNDLPISRLPVTVANEDSGGWSDLYKPESGGGAKPSVVRYEFNGERYVERERLPPDGSPDDGVELLGGDLGFESGVELTPP